MSKYTLQGSLEIVLRKYGQPMRYDNFDIFYKADYLDLGLQWLPIMLRQPLKIP